MQLVDQSQCSHYHDQSRTLLTPLMFVAIVVGHPSRTPTHAGYAFDAARIALPTVLALAQVGYTIPKLRRRYRPPPIATLNSSHSSHR